MRRSDKKEPTKRMLALLDYLGIRMEEVEFRDEGIGVSSLGDELYFKNIEGLMAWASALIKHRQYQHMLDNALSPVDYPGIGSLLEWPVLETNDYKIIPHYRYENYLNPNGLEIKYRPCLNVNFAELFVIESIQMVNMITRTSRAKPMLGQTCQYRHEVLLAIMNIKQEK